MQNARTHLPNQIIRLQYSITEQYIAFPNFTNTSVLIRDENLKCDINQFIFDSGDNSVTLSS